MIAIQRLYELGIEIKSEVEPVHSFLMVQDESEVVNGLQKHKIADNHLLIIVIPSTNSNGSRDVDAIQYNEIHQFLVLEKRDPKLPKNNLEDMMIYARTQATLNQIIEYVLHQINTEADSSCEIFRSIDASSFDIEPVKGLSDCFGYSWTFKLRI